MNWENYKSKVEATIHEYAEMPVTPHTAEAMRELLDTWGIACNMARSHKEPEEDADFHRWAAHLENADGTHGAHWTIEQSEQLRRGHGIKADPADFWMALNATYSDLCGVMRKYGLDTPAAYADFAVSFWLEDCDAVPDKLEEYYRHVVRK